METCITDIQDELGRLIEVKHGKHVKQYRVSDAGTYYSDKTNLALTGILDTSIGRRGHATRLLLVYGDNDKLKLWGDADRCYIGRSGGEVKIPLVVYNTRSTGGGALLDDCICAVYETTNPYNRIWSHPNWNAAVLRQQFLKLKESGDLYIRG